MKKFLALALCLGTCGAMFADNPEAKALYQEGKQQYDAYDGARTKQMINPNDPSINTFDMANQLLSGYKTFMKVLPLDSLPDAKGKVKPKYSKNVVKALNSHHNDFFLAGITFNEKQKFYPEAYEAFMIYGDLPKSKYADKFIASTPDSLINKAYFYAGVMANQGGALPESAAAFHKARMNGAEEADTYINELACWWAISQKDTTKVDEAMKQIEEIATAGYKKFGVNPPIFVTNLVSSWTQSGRKQNATNLVNDLLKSNPNSSALYSLRGYIYDIDGNDQESVNDYRKAASMEDADFDTLKRAANKIMRVGTQKWNDMEGNNPELRNDIKVNYFEAAQTIAEKAKKLNPNDSDIQRILDSVDYALTTYFQ